VTPEERAQSIAKMATEHRRRHTNGEYHRTIAHWICEAIRAAENDALERAAQQVDEVLRSWCNRRGDASYAYERQGADEIADAVRALKHRETT